MSQFQVTIDGKPYEIALAPKGHSGETYEVTVNGEPLEIILPHHAGPISGVEWIIIDGRPYEIVFDANLQWVNAWDGLHTVEVHDLNQRVARPRSGDGRIKAPIPGLITRVLVEPGATVQTGQPMLVLEAMKMENEIRAPFDGVVTSIAVAGGQTVVSNQMLAEVQ